MHSRFTRTVAVLVCLILGQTLAGALLHTMLVDHIWCETHQDFEHVEGDLDTSGQHAEQANAESDDTRHAANEDASNQDFSHEQPSNKHHPGDDKRTPDSLCYYLTSMHGPAVPLPSIYASLLNLPPPTEVGTASPLPGNLAILPRQIELLHESPGLSPPQLMA